MKRCKYCNKEIKIDKGFERFCDRICEQLEWDREIEELDEKKQL